ncbi:MAG: hypothetical protein ACLU37_11050 [Collinsella sp.]
MPWSACAQAAPAALDGGTRPASRCHVLLHEQMLANYRALYDETARAFNLPKKEV